MMLLDELELLLGRVVSLPELDRTALLKLASERETHPHTIAVIQLLFTAHTADPVALTPEVPAQ